MVRIDHLELARIDDALRAVGVAVDDVVACVVSHLHVDHCGQLGVLSCPVHVQRVEHEAATAAPVLLTWLEEEIGQSGCAAR